MMKGIITMCLLGAATWAQAATTGEEAHAPLVESAPESTAEIAALLGEEESEVAAFFGLNTQTVKVYNASDELVAEGTLDAFGQACDPALSEVLRKADRLMTLGDTHFYRLD